jgi:hypothetical protein
MYEADYRTLCAASCDIQERRVGMRLTRISKESSAEVKCRNGTIYSSPRLAGVVWCGVVKNGVWHSATFSLRRSSDQ